MVITVDRNSGIFSESLSDKINSQSNSIYENIASMKVPPMRIRENVVGFRVDPAVEMDQFNYSIGNAHFVNLLVKGSIRSEDMSWVRLCTVPTAPAVNVYTLTAIPNSSTAAQAIARIDAGTRDVLLDTFGATISNFRVYFFYIK